MGRICIKEFVKAKDKARQPEVKLKTHEVIQQILSDIKSQLPVQSICSLMEKSSQGKSFFPQLKN